MAELVQGGTLTTGWLEAMMRISERGGEIYNLIVEVSDPETQGADDRMVAELEALLSASGLQPVDTVANTIFPSSLVRPSSDRQELYDRYLRLVPRLRKNRKNWRGTYFERLISYPMGSDAGPAVNQIEEIITALQQELSSPRPLRFIYEAQVFVPGKDSRPIGFPCMSSLSFQLEGEWLRSTATYRNQYYIARALGNFIGLSRLQSFIAEQAGLRQGPLTIHAFHAQLDPKVSKPAIAELIGRCRTLTPVPSSTAIPGQAVQVNATS
jgi:hypothetical protein